MLNFGVFAVNLPPMLLDLASRSLPAFIAAGLLWLITRRFAGETWAEFWRRMIAGALFVVGVLAVVNLAGTEGPQLNQMISSPEAAD